MNINEIAKQANELPRKTTKPMAFNIVADLCQGEPLTQERLAMLYSHFMPALPKKAKTPFDWVARAMAKGDIRAYLEYVYSDGENTVAIDGHRLHIFEGEGLEKGFYDKAGAFLGETISAGRFPEYQRVIPKSCTHELFLDDAEVIAAKHSGDWSTYDFGEGLPMVNKIYLDQAMRDLENVQLFANDDHPEVSSMIITGLLNDSPVKAVIMPVRK